jgi:hypothetical protein
MEKFGFSYLKQNINTALVLLLCLVLSSLGANGQDLESLSKKELRTLCDERSEKIDSLQLAISLLFGKFQKTQDELNTKTEKIRNLEIRIQDNLANLNDLLRSGVEKDSSIAKQSARISMMENELFMLHQQFDGLQSYADSLNLFLNSSPQQRLPEQGEVDKVNWLDKLEFGSAQLPDGKLSFNLEGVIAFNNTLGTIKSVGNDYFAEEVGLTFGPTPFIPEFIPSNDLNFYFLKKNNDEKLDVLNSLTSRDFDAMMPVLEIIKGKIATFNYSDGGEENFFVTLMEIKNNGIIQGQLNFAHEIATNSIQWGGNLNDAYKVSKDLFYPVGEIDGVKYIILNNTQLSRLGLPISRASLFGPMSGNKIVLEKLDNDWGASVQTGDFFLSRDRTGSSPYFLPHNDCLFLFTLVP